VSERREAARDDRSQATLTRAAVWDALARIPDPEIPVISLVDLGVVTDVDVADGTVRVELTPTFLGCPALEAMTTAIRDEVTALGADVDVRVRTDREWTTDRITPEGREKLRTAGFAPPTPRTGSAPTLVQLERGPFRCPWCGSTDTKLENVFGPTPCRSLRYCDSCRQPFEQFKTI
jgi:ring-1,2-phenylacetyl-CoA epoxidase subunit PaaD